MPGGRKNGLGQIGKVLMTAFLLVAALFFAGMALLFVYHTTEMNADREMEVTEIGDARPGERVKVHGTIMADESLVISGHAGNAGWEGIVRPFALQDGSGSLNLTPEDVDDLKVYDPPHRRKGEDEFHTGDEAWVVGEIQTGRNDTTLLMLESISGTPDGFPYPYGELFISTLLVMVPFLFISLIVPMLLSRDDEEFWDNRTVRSAYVLHYFAVVALASGLALLLAARAWQGWLPSAGLYLVTTALLGFGLVRARRRSQTAAQYRTLREVALEGRNLLPELLRSELERQRLTTGFKQSEEKVRRFGFIIIDTHTHLFYELLTYEATLEIVYTLKPRPMNVWFFIHPVSLEQQETLLPLLQRVIETALEGYEAE